MYEPLSETYKTLTIDREQFLERGYRSSVFTIPSLLPREGVGRDRLPQNYQSVGARGANTLSSKLTLTLFPSNLPFFRLSVDPFLKRILIQEAGEEDAAKAQGEIEKNLSLIEETARLTFETGGWRPVMSEAMRHLVVVGNGLIMVNPSTQEVQFVDLRKFAVKRDPEGNLIKAVVHQKIDRLRAAELMPDALDHEVGFNYDPGRGIGAADPNSVSLFTGVCLKDDGLYHYWQEIGGKVVPDSQRKFKKDDCPLIPLRFNAISGENYGSSFVEELDGDLLALEMLSRAMTEAALAASKTVILVRPGASVTARTIATAPNGGVKQGNPEDVGAFRIDKQADFMVAERRAVALEQRLATAFMIAYQRQAERVSATEVRAVIQELEDGLGGVYSSLANTVQRPIVEYLMSRVQKRQDVPDIPKGVDPIISTGIEAITRGQMASKLMQAGQISQQVLGPEQAVGALNPRAALLQIFTSVGLDADALLKSEEQIEQELQQRQMMALAERAAPNVVNAAAQSAQAPPS